MFLKSGKFTIFLSQKLTVYTDCHTCAICRSIYRSLLSGQRMLVLGEILKFLEFYCSVCSFVCSSGNRAKQRYLMHWFILTVLLWKKKFKKLHFKKVWSCKLQSLIVYLNNYRSRCQNFKDNYTTKSSTNMFPIPQALNYTH